MTYEQIFALIDNRKGIVAATGVTKNNARVIFKRGRLPKRYWLEVIEYAQSLGKALTHDDLKLADEAWLRENGELSVEAAE